MSIQKEIKTLRAAIESPATPPEMKEEMKKTLSELEAKDSAAGEPTPVTEKPSPKGKKVKPARKVKKVKVHRKAKKKYSAKECQVMCEEGAPLDFGDFEIHHGLRGKKTCVILFPDDTTGRVKKCNLDLSDNEFHEILTRYEKDGSVSYEQLTQILEVPKREKLPPKEKVKSARKIRRKYAKRKKREKVKKEVKSKKIRVKKAPKKPEVKPKHKKPMSPGMTGDDRIIHDIVGGSRESVISGESLRIAGFNLSKLSDGHHETRHYVIHKPMWRWNYLVTRKVAEEGAILEEGGQLASGGRLAEIYADRGAKSAEKVLWNSWDPEQRKHFLIDHKKEIPEKIYQDLDWSAEFDYIPEEVKWSVIRHFAVGQYAKGGSPKRAPAKGSSLKEAMIRAKATRGDGEAWKDALKRASEELRSEAP